MIDRWKHVWLPLACAGVMSACAGNGPAPAQNQSTFDSIQRNIFNVSCLSAGCHNSSDQAANLVLEQGHSFTNLVGVVPFTTAAAAAGLLRVDPGHPENSFLLTKVTGPSNPQFGSRMPLSGSGLSTADVDQIRNWILSLATTPSPIVPTATPSLAPTATAAFTASATPSITLTPTITATPSITATSTPTSTGTLPPSATPTQTPLPSATATPTPSPSASPTATPSPSPTATPSPLPTPTFSLDSTFPQIQTTIFSTCLGLSCHNAQDLAGGNNLEPGSAYASLVGVVPQNPTAAAAGLLRVDPGKPENSFLITKLTLPKSFDTNFGSRMPSGQPPLSAAQIEQIRAWILRGALPDETGP